jgi:hypothetical protein
MDGGGQVLDYAVGALPGSSCVCAGEELSDVCWVILSSWVRQGDDSWYAVGRRAKVECVVFDALQPIGELPVVTRIWIGAEGP